MKNRLSEHRRLKRKIIRTNADLFFVFGTNRDDNSFNKLEKYNRVESVGKNNFIPNEEYN